MGGTNCSGYRVLLALLLAFSFGISHAASDYDSDQDGVYDSQDNCIYAYNPDQYDGDGDWVGDACDACPNEYGTGADGCPEQTNDYDGDGVQDEYDNCPYVSNKAQSDSDDDGIGDACDSCDNRDNDQDGIANCDDQCPDDYGPESNYGCPETAPDSDQDGIYDSYDNCPYVYNPNQDDEDDDWIGDGCDSCDNRDSDKDGIANCDDQCPEEQGTSANYGCPETEQQISIETATTDETSGESGARISVDASGGGQISLIEIYFNDAKTPSASCKSNPKCTFNTGKLDPGSYVFTVYVLDVLGNGVTKYGNVIVSQNATNSCLPLQGRMTGFIYNIDSLQVVAEKMDTERWSKAPYKSNPYEYLTGQKLIAYLEYAPDSFDMVYSVCLPRGKWLVSPIFNQNSDACPWTSLWTPGYHIVDINSSGTSRNFTYVPADSSPPRLSVSANPTAYNSAASNIITANATDPDGIASMRIYLYDDRMSLISSANCTSSPCRLTIPTIANTVQSLDIRARACDIYGNEGTGNLRYDASSCYDLVQNGRETGVDCGGPCQACIPCTWCGANVTPIVIHGRPTDGYIDVVFVADNTYRTTNFSNFISDAKNIISNAYYTMSNRTEPAIPDYRRKFNFYYWNTVNPNVSTGMCHRPNPPGFFEAAPFTDAVALIYATGGTGGCSGWPTRATFRTPGRVNGVAPADSAAVQRMVLGQALHEAGHGIFELVDTYCGDTPYWQPSAWPNVWTSLSRCQNDINGRNASSANGAFWNSANCRQITDGSCSKSFYRYDPDVPDDELMEWGMVHYGPAGTIKIKWTFENRYSTG